MFEIDVSKLDNLESIFVIRHRRLNGDSDHYKSLCNSVLSEIKI